MAAQPPKKSGLSLYADLLEPDKQKTSGATISGAPVRYDVKNSGGDDEGARKKDASLKFQPIKRPQVAQKAKNKPTSSSSLHKFSSSTVTATTSASASSPEKNITTSTPQTQQQPSVQQSNIEDWLGDDDDHYYQNDRPKAERGGRKKKKKNKPQERVWDWDDIYDPTLPNSYADYKGSEEQAREIRDWKARLYYHQLKEAKKATKNGSAYSDEEEEIRPRQMNSMFAPPSNLNFAPPSFGDNTVPATMDIDEDGDDYYPPDTLNTSDRERRSYDSPPAFARASIPDDSTGDDAYMRRMRMSGMTQAEAPAPPPPPPPPSSNPAPIYEAAAAPQPIAKAADADVEAKRAEAQAKIAAFKARIAGQAAKPPIPAATQDTSAPVASSETPPPPPPPPPPQEESGSTISRAPVRYNIPPTPSILEDEATASSNGRSTSTPPSEQAKTNRPGQKGFAERLLKRYGWEKGQGLGASGSGITTAIVAKAEKRKKLPDAEGGGWAVPANMGKIVGGKKRKLSPSAADEEAGMADAKFGPMSEVVKMSGMLDGLDVQREIEEKNLMQEIGEEMQSQYGNVERVFIWREESGGSNEVFVKFTSQLSALRAVQGMDGAEFAGNGVRARFWDGGAFERGDYA